MIRVLLTSLLLATSAFPAAANTRDYLKKPDDWFRSTACRERLANLLSHQDQAGCWPKNLDPTERPYRGEPKNLKGTFDNSATVNELRLLARAYRVTRNDHYKDAFQLGIKCILKAQYDNGGWPQSPNPSGYSQHITFNDGTMVGLMTLLREVSEMDDSPLLSPKTRRQAREAFDRGVQCILACQIKVDGRLTAWCAQHDRKSLEPRGARAYEHPSLSGSESAGVVCLLMSLEDPSKEIRRSIRAGVNWFEQAKVTGIRFKKKKGDYRILRDPKAPPLWARFYEINTNRPIFSGRDGVIKYDVAEIEAERRNGYAWYGSSGKRVAASWAKWNWR